MKPRQLTAKILSGFLKFKAKRPTPLFASYNVTGRCNMRCVFCEWWKTTTPELPTKKAIAAIDAVCSLGVPFFDLSGGEPLLRKDLITLAKRVASHGCLVSMNTNGTLLDESRISGITDIFDLVVVSLDGPKGIHDRIRGVPGTYDKAVKAIKLLKANEVRVGVNSVVTPWNIKILPQFMEELRSQVDFVQVQPIHPYPPPAENAPPEKEVSKFLKYMMMLKRSDPGFLAVPKDYIKGFNRFFKGEAPKICHAGELYIGIDPAGKLLACPARSDIVLGDTLSGSIGDVLKDKQCNEEGWREVSACRGCWLECTVGVSMLLENPFKEASQFISLWASRKA
jgi:MoaA/NifB/PqqE/SkfB family radical SAM enzyme